MRTICVIPEQAEVHEYTSELGELVSAAFHEFLQVDNFRFLLNETKRVIYFEGQEIECLILKETFGFLNEAYGYLSTFYIEDNGRVIKSVHNPCLN